MADAAGAEYPARLDDVAAHVQHCADWATPIVAGIVSAGGHDGRIHLNVGDGVARRVFVYHLNVLRDNSHHAGIGQEGGVARIALRQRLPAPVFLARRIVGDAAVNVDVMARVGGERQHGLIGDHAGDAAGFRRRLAADVAVAVDDAVGHAGVGVVGRRRLKAAAAVAEVIHMHLRRRRTCGGSLRQRRRIRVAVGVGLLDLDDLGRAVIRVHAQGHLLHRAVNVHPAGRLSAAVGNQHSGCRRQARRRGGAAGGRRRLSHCRVLLREVRCRHGDHRDSGMNSAGAGGGDHLPFGLAGGRRRISVSVAVPVDGRAGNRERIAAAVGENRRDRDAAGAVAPLDVVERAVWCRRISVVRVVGMDRPVKDVQAGPPVGVRRRAVDKDRVVAERGLLDIRLHGLRDAAAGSGGLDQVLLDRPLAGVVIDGGIVERIGEDPDRKCSAAQRKNDAGIVGMPAPRRERKRFVGVRRTGKRMQPLQRILDAGVRDVERRRGLHLPRRRLVAVFGHAEQAAAALRPGEDADEDQAEEGEQHQHPACQRHAALTPLVVFERLYHCDFALLKEPCPVARLPSVLPRMAG